MKEVINKTRIQTIPREVRRSFEEERHKLWVQSPSSSYGAQDLEPQISTKELLDYLTGLPPESVLCLYSSELSEDVNIFIQRAYEAGHRLYLLSNERPSSIKKTLYGQFLLRYGLSECDSFLLINPQEQPSGFYMTGSLEREGQGAPQAKLQLNEEQVTKFFSFFKQLFWEKAKQEVLSEKDYEQPRQVESRPVEQPTLSFGIPSSLDEIQLPYLKGQEQGYKALEVEELRLALISPATFHEVFNEPIPNRDVLAQNAFPFYFAADEDQYYLLSSKMTWCLTLNTEQGQAIDELSQCSAQWSFQEVALKELRKQYLWHPGGKVPFELKEHSDIELQEISLNKLLPRAEFEQMQPHKVGEWDQKSLSITYRWEVKPYYQPNSAQKDHIYKKWEQWRRAIEREAKALEDLMEKYQAYFTPQEQLQQKGFIRQLNEMLEQLPEINQKDQGSNLLETHLQRSADIRALIKKALERQLRELEEEVQQLQVSKASFEEEKKAEANRHYEEKYGTVDKKELSKKDRRKWSASEAQILKRLFPDEKQYKSQQKQLTDIKTALKGYQQDKDEQESNLSKLQKGKAKKKTKDLVVPNGLPQVGRLYLHKNKRYLAIQYWEEYAQGQSEAQRLNAELCAAR